MSRTNQVNVMVDLETLDTSPTGVIVSIGAVEFAAHGRGREFYSVLNIQDQLELGRTISASTLAWWMKQGPEARKVFQEEPHRLWEALEEFSQWLKECEGTPRIWGNGASFDNSMLSHCYHSAKVDQPWKFTNDACYRTLKSLAPGIKAGPRHGTFHNALDDAIYQADHAIALMNYLQATY